MNNVYFDNAASMEMSVKVKQAMVDAPWGNSNSLHDLGLQSKKIVKETEEKILRLINAPDGQIIWTSGGSEANYLIQFSELMTRSALDHSSLNLCEPAWKIDQDGYLIPESNKRCYHFYNTFQLVNNEIGTIQSIDKIDNYHILHKGKYGIHNITGSYRKTHSDCVQALGKIPINVQKLGVQSISLSAHKIGGPKGIGCLWISDQLLSLVHSAFKSYIPLNYKLNHPVTLNISGIAGFSAALDEIDLDQYEGQMETLNETLFTILTNSNAFPDSLTFNNLLSISRGSSIFSVRTPGIFGTDLMMRLNQKGVYVSTGSACHSKEEKPSQVLQAIGLTDEQALSTIRISMSKNNTVKEVIEGSKIILETIKEMNNEV